MIRGVYLLKRINVQSLSSIHVYKQKVSCFLVLPHTQKSPSIEQGSHSALIMSDKEKSPPLGAFKLCPLKSSSAPIQFGNQIHEQKSTNLSGVDQELKAGPSPITTECLGNTASGNTKELDIELAAMKEQLSWQQPMSSVVALPADVPSTDKISFLVPDSIAGADADTKLESLDSFVTIATRTKDADAAEGDTKVLHPLSSGGKFFKEADDKTSGQTNSVKTVDCKIEVQSTEVQAEGLKKIKSTMSGIPNTRKVSSSANSKPSSINAGREHNKMLGDNKHDKNSNANVPHVRTSTVRTDRVKGVTAKTSTKDVPSRKVGNVKMSHDKDSSRKSTHLANSVGKRTVVKEFKTETEPVKSVQTKTKSDKPLDTDTVSVRREDTRTSTKKSSLGVTGKKAANVTNLATNMKNVGKIAIGVKQNKDPEPSCSKYEAERLKNDEDMDSERESGNVEHTESVTPNTASSKELDIAQDTSCEETGAKVSVSEVESKSKGIQDKSERLSTAKRSGGKPLSSKTGIDRIEGNIKDVRKQSKGSEVTVKRKRNQDLLSAGATEASGSKQKFKNTGESQLEKTNPLIRKEGVRSDSGGNSQNEKEVFELFKTDSETKKEIASVVESESGSIKDGKRDSFQTGSALRQPDSKKVRKAKSSSSSIVRTGSSRKSPTDARSKTTLLTSSRQEKAGKDNDSLRKHGKEQKSDDQSLSKRASHQKQKPVRRALAGCNGNKTPVKGASRSSKDKLNATSHVQGSDIPQQNSGCQTDNASKKLCVEVRTVKNVLSGERRGKKTVLPASLLKTVTETVRQKVTVKAVSSNVACTQDLDVGGKQKNTCNSGDSGSVETVVDTSRESGAGADKIDTEKKHLKLIEDAPTNGKESIEVTFDENVMAQVKTMAKQVEDNNSTVPKDKHIPVNRDGVSGSTLVEPDHQEPEAEEVTVKVEEEEENPFMEMDVSGITAESSHAQDTEMDKDVIDISVLFSESFDKEYQKSLRRARKKAIKRRRRDKLREKKGKEPRTKHESLGSISDDELESIPEEASDKKAKGKKYGGKKAISPNYFVALQVSNPKIHAELNAIQQSVLKQNMDLAPSLIPIATLHLTVMVMKLSTEEEINSAKLALNACAVHLKQLYNKNPLMVDIQGLGNFRNNVVFARVQDQGHLHQLQEVADVVLNKHKENGIESTDKRTEFKPHITIMKLSKGRKLRKKGIKQIEPSLYNDQQDKMFGSESMVWLQLCSMFKKKSPSGYYHIEHCAYFGPGDPPQKMSWDEEAMSRTEKECVNEKDTEIRTIAAEIVADVIEKAKAVVSGEKEAEMRAVAARLVADVVEKAKSVVYEASAVQCTDEMVASRNSVENQLDSLEEVKATGESIDSDQVGEPSGVSDPNVAQVASRLVTGTIDKSKQKLLLSVAESLIHNREQHLETHGTEDIGQLVGEMNANSKTEVNVDEAGTGTATVETQTENQSSLDVNNQNCSQSLDVDISKENDGETDVGDILGFK